MPIPYFKHFNTMRDNPMVVEMMIEEKMEGYGIYIALLEMLLLCDGVLTATSLHRLCVRIAYELRVEQSTVKRIIEDYGLFEIEEAQDSIAVHSIVLSEDLKQLRATQTSRKQICQKAAQVRWAKKNASGLNGDTTPQPQNNAQSMHDAYSEDAQRIHDAPKNDAKIKNKDIDIPLVSPSGEKPTTEKVSEKRKREREEFISSVPPDWKAPFETWLTYKRERGESYKTASGLAAALKGMQEVSGNNPKEATRCIEQSKANNYSGLFALKNQKTQIKPTTGINRVSQWN